MNGEPGNGPASFPYLKIEKINYQTNICPLPTIAEDTWYLIELYEHYKNGHLLYPGGVIEQPDKYLKSMRLVDAIINASTKD